MDSLPTSPTPASLSPDLNAPLLPPNTATIFHDRSSTPNSTQPHSRVASSAWDSHTSIVEKDQLLAVSPRQAQFAAIADPFDTDLPKRNASKNSKRRLWFLLALIGAVVIIAVAVAVPVYFAVIRPHKLSSSGSSASPTSSGSATPSNSSTPTQNLISGGDGSTVTTDAGVTFIYNNSFGGYWLQDPTNPFNGGRANEWTPAINESWSWGVDKINGVNIGGWLVLEPFITPPLYQKYQNISVPAKDEWTLSEAMIADTSPGGGLSQIEDHYKTFITEVDFAQIAAAGLNWVRIPLPFWAISTIPEEPFLEGVAWTYFLKAVGWARKYGLRINLDLHTIPGSQNGWNHSGKQGQINFLAGVMGLVNAQRAFDYIRFLTEFISEPEFASVVPFFGIVNEPQNTIGITLVKNFYYEAYMMMRGITGLGNGNGPFVSIHDAFAQSEWAGFMEGADRLALDFHPYAIFSGGPSTAPPASFADVACNSWGNFVNSTSSNFGLITAGEFSTAVNDCGLYVLGVNVESEYESSQGPGSCDQWTDYATYTNDTIQGLRTFVTASMDALQSWFFWTWKIAPSAVSGQVEAPFWSYQLGMQNGWIPTDPREAIGACAASGNPPTEPFDGNYEPWQTGGPGGLLAPTTTESYAWPPPTISGEANVAALPSYTPTGAIPTLPVPTFTPSATPSVNGWFDAQDTRPAYVPISGCTYPDNWNALTIPVPPLCTGS